MKKYLLLAVCLFQYSIHAYKTIAVHTLNLNSVDHFYGDNLHAYESCVIKAKTFRGNANIKSPNVIIICDKFEFTGTFECDKSCIIYAKQNFDTGNIKKSGSGKFKVVISPYEFVHYNTEELLIKSYLKSFKDNCLELTLDIIDEKLTNINKISVLNFYNESHVLLELRKNIEAEINSIKSCLNQKYKIDALTKGLFKSGISVVLLIEACYLGLYDKNEKYNNMSVGLMLFLFSTFMMYHSLSDFKSAPTRNKEIYEKLSMILKRIDHALSVDEKVDMQIIDL